VLGRFIALLRTRISVMAKVSKTPRLKRAAAQAAARVAPQERASLGTADDRALDRACRAGGAANGQTRAADYRAGAREPRDRPVSLDVEGKFSASPLEDAQSPERISELVRPRLTAQSNRLAAKSKGNFWPRNPLKSLKTEQESRSRLAASEPRSISPKPGWRRVRREIFRLATP
jgi:hypothetical protein